MDQNTEMLELLRSIEKSNRRRTTVTIVLGLLMLAAALGCIALCMNVSALVPQVEGILTQMDTVLQNLEQTSRDLAALDLQAMVENVDSLAVFAQDSLAQTMEKLDTIDFETLNQAIENLSKVIEPMARFAKMFG